MNVKVIHFSGTKNNILDCDWICVMSHLEMIATVYNKYFMVVSINIYKY